MYLSFAAPRTGIKPAYSRAIPRFTQLTHGVSKKIANLAYAVSLHYMHYNFARVHQSLTITNQDGTTIKRTPAMAVGVTDRVWSLREIAGVLDSN
jgi:hypothetical protein